MPPRSQCPRCHAPLSLPADCCQACGYLLTEVEARSPFDDASDLDFDADRSGPGLTATLLPPPTAVPVSDGTGLDPTPPPSPTAAAGREGESQDEARLASLLGQIAAQSHFEERYEVRGRLNMGGMGGIFRAYDRVLRREVAVKMMHEGLRDAEAEARGQFLKEARVGARLLHPHVLPVFDLGVNRPGQIYFTMRLVDGGSLKDCLDALDRAAGTRLIAYHRYWAGPSIIQSPFQ